MVKNTQKQSAKAVDKGPVKKTWLLFFGFALVGAGIDMLLHSFPTGFFMGAGSGLLIMFLVQNANRK